MKTTEARTEQGLRLVFTDVQDDHELVALLREGDWTASSFKNPSRRPSPLKSPSLVNILKLYQHATDRMMIHSCSLRSHRGAGTDGRGQRHTLKDCISGLHGRVPAWR
jgi:hypothetical protein